MDSFLDEVLEEIGVENVVQIIKNSTSGYMHTLRMQLMQKHRSIFWTMSASYCIDMMLNDIGMINIVKDVLEKAKSISKFICNHAFVLENLKKHTCGFDNFESSKTGSTEPFLILEHILSGKKCIKEVFTSSDWNTSICSFTQEGKKVADLVVDRLFWKEATKVLKATIPLVHVLDLINVGDSQQLGVIYETIDQAKETIKKELKNRKSQYMPFWDSIDKIWDNYLHSPLHSAGYFLNPSLFYSSLFLPDAEVVSGLLCCIVPMAENRQVQDLISLQLDAYREARGAFGFRSSIQQQSNIYPECPQLQKLAIRILSQTCASASRYSLDKSVAEMLLVGGRNPLEQKSLCDLTFLRYNMHLQNFKSSVRKNFQKTSLR